MGYQQTLEKVLLGDPAVVRSPAFERVWTRTEVLRRAILEEVKRDNLGGFRRGDVMNAVHFYINKDRTPVHDVRDIWSGLRDEKLASDVRKFLKWCSYAYQYNQGRMFGLSPSLASMDDIDVEFSRHLTTTGKDDQSGTQWNDEFVIPSEDALLTIEPEYLFDVRDGATGADYFDAVEAWQRQPSADTSNILLDKLSAYAGELTRLYIAKGRSVVNWEWHLNAHVPEDKIWNRTGLELAKDLMGELIPHFGLLSLVGPLGAATYEWWPASVSKRFGVNQRISLEIETGTKRLQVTSARAIDASFK